MKKGWSKQPLGALCEVVAGQSPEGKSYNSDGNGLPFYQGKKNFGEKFIEAPTTWTTQTTKVAREGDILMSVRAPVGPVNFATQELCIGRGLAAIRSRGELDRDFLFYQLWHLQPEIAGKEGAVFASINKSEIEALPVAFAPLLEQQRIVGILDEAFEGIATAKANAEKNLQNARSVFERYLDAVFLRGGEGWKETTLGEIAAIKGGKRVPNGYKMEEVPTGFPYLRVTDFNDAGTIDVDDLRYVSAKVHRTIERYIIRSVDLYISIAGTIGKAGIVPPELDGAHLTENACRLVFRPEILNRFIYYFTQTASFTEQTGLSVRTTAQPKLALSRLATIKLKVPSLSAQQSFVSHFDALRDETRNLQQVYEQKLDALDSLKKSLLHQAFSGQL